jgi:hypothetical protein
MQGNIWQVSIYILQAKQFYKVQVQWYEIVIKSAVLKHSGFLCQTKD